MSGHSLSITEAGYLERLRAYKRLFKNWLDIYKLRDGPFVVNLQTQGIQFVLAVKSLQDGIAFPLNSQRNFYSDYIDRYIASKNIALMFDVNECIFRPYHILGRTYIPFNEYISMLEMCIETKVIKGNKPISIPKVVTDKNITIIIMDGKTVINKMYVDKELDIGNLLWLYNEVMKIASRILFRKSNQQNETINQ